jgi:fermentation-respiration switch protein FrsA (DUF1100 family)
MGIKQAVLNVILCSRVLKCGSSLNQELESLASGMIQYLKHFHLSAKHMWVSVLGGSIGIFSVLIAVGLYIVEALTRPNKKRNFYDEYTFTPYELGLPAEVVTFPSAEGAHLVGGWFIPNEGATTTILVCPGFRTRKSDILGISAHLWKAGHNVLIFEYYGHGTTAGTPVTLGYREIHDFLGAVAYAKERAPHTHLGVIGYSMGASIAIMCSARTPEIEAIVSDSAFATHWGVVDYNVRRAYVWPSLLFVWIADQLMGWRAGYHFKEVEPLRDIGSISPRPILLIQGGKDSIVDPHDVTLLYGKASEPKELWFVPEADHCGAYFVDRIAYTQRVIAFFDRYLRRPRLQLIESLDDGVSEAQELQDLPEAS